MSGEQGDSQSGAPAFYKQEIVFGEVQDAIRKMKRGKVPMTRESIKKREQTKKKKKREHRGRGSRERVRKREKANTLKRERASRKEREKGEEHQRGEERHHEKERRKKRGDSNLFSASKHCVRNLAVCEFIDSGCDVCCMSSSSSSSWSRNTHSFWKR